jgi:hypothetical protein
MALRYDRAIRKATKLERKLIKQKYERSVYPTMAHQVDFSLNPYDKNRPVRFAAALAKAPVIQNTGQIQNQPVFHPEPQIYQRQFQNLGRLYTCYTCMGCQMAIPCQQQIFQPQPAYSAQPAFAAQPAYSQPNYSQNTPCQKMAAVQQRPNLMTNRQMPSNNCNCASDQRTCNQPITKGRFTIQSDISIYW